MPSVATMTACAACLLRTGLSENIRSAKEKARAKLEKPFLYFTKLLASEHYSRLSAAQTAFLVTQGKTPFGPAPIPATILPLPMLIKPICIFELP